jgi:hypothetical protein
MKLGGVIAYIGRLVSRVTVGPAQRKIEISKGR